MSKVADEYRRRLQLLNKIEKDQELAALEVEMCKRNPVHFVNNWGLTYDPRINPKHLPFIPYEFQINAFSWITDRFKNKENGLIEKTRDMGASWMVCAWTIHAWLFQSGFTALFGSRKEDLVDNGLMDSLFGKLRYFIYRLPKFLRPEIAQRTKTDRYLTLVNPNNGNEITGESANPGFGRGGRSSIVFLDEFAHVSHSEAVWASVSENSDCIIPLSTPFGKDNQFAWLKFHAKIPTLALHWSLHPEKTEAWYEKKKLTMKPWQIAQELDLSYERSLEGRVYSRFDRNYNVPRGIIGCIPEYEQFIAWDFGIADPTALLFGQVTTDGRIQIWNCIEMTDQDIDFFIPITKGLRPKEYPRLSKDDQDLIDRTLKKIPLGHTADHYGDHAGTSRTANSKRSCRDALKQHDIDLKTSGKQTFDWRIECVENILKLRYSASIDKWYSIFEVSPDCERFIDCIFNYIYDSEVISDDKLRPKHNWASHMVTALEFLCINRFPVRKSGGMREEKIR